MVAGQHKLSRRAVLAGACGAAALPPRPGLDPGARFRSTAGTNSGIPDQVRDDEGRRSAWRKALARYARASAELEELAHCEDDDLYDRALGRHNAALARLLRAPAPDFAAAAGKLNLILRHAVHELTFGEACLAALQRDLRRFAGLPPSPPSRLSRLA